MSETTNIRQERIERLLHELEYECTRGMLEREIGEELTFRFVIGISSKIPDGVIMCEFKTRPIHRYMVFNWDISPRLKIVK